MKFVLRGVAVAVLLLAFSGAVFYSDPLWVNDQAIRFKLWRHGVHSRYVDAGGYRLHYLESAPANGPGTPLVLIHGLGSRGEDWAPLIPGLTASGFHVYVPDLPGYGRSPRPDADYSISMQEKTVVAFMQAKGLSKADIAGWSMGGWVAAKLTIDHPETVDRLVLYDSAGLYFAPPFDAASLFVPTDTAGLALLMGMLQPNPRPMPDFVARAAIKRLDRNGWVIRRSVGAMMSGRDLLDFRLTSIQRPTLLVWGSKDALFPVDLAESMHHSIPNSSLTLIDGCGHLAPAECWHSTLATTVQFLQAQPPLAGKEQTLPGS